MNVKPVWEKLDPKAGFSDGAGLYYSKDNSGYVHLNGTIQADSFPTSSQVIGTMPAGFRPTKSIVINVTAGNSNWSTYLWISHDGNISFPSSITPGLTNGHHWCIDCHYYAQ